MTTVETALGPVPTTELGPTLMHERGARDDHGRCIQRSPGAKS